MVEPSTAGVLVHRQGLHPLFAPGEKLATHVAVSNAVCLLRYTVGACRWIREVANTLPCTAATHPVAAAAWACQLDLPSRPALPGRAHLLGAQPAAPASAARAGSRHQPHRGEAVSQC